MKLNCDLCGKQFPVDSAKIDQHINIICKICSLEFKTKIYCPFCGNRNTINMSEMKTCQESGDITREITLPCLQCKQHSEITLHLDSNE